ncbi:MAG: DMT family transporter [Deltaproteobacteria bacterium]|nr:DMT family transporter [Deltaproteobacteria bacterium]
MVAVFLGLVSSLFFAAATVAIHRGLLKMDYLSGLLVNLFTNALFLWIFLGLFFGTAELWVPANLIFVGVGFVVPGLPRLLIFKGVVRLGASISSMMMSATPLFAILIAFVFLRERPGLSILLGAFFIVIGVISLCWRGETKTWRAIDLLLPRTGGLLFALRDNLVRFGLLITASPVMGATIVSTTSAIMAGTLYFSISGTRGLVEADRSGLGWFFFSGFLNFLSYFSMFTAFNLERVSVVTPLASCASLFTPLFAYFLLREEDPITSRKVTATVLVVLGVFLIAWEKM